MPRTHRLSTTGALIVCLVGTQWSGTLLASAEEPSTSAAPSSQTVVNSTSEAQEGTGAANTAVSASELSTSATEIPRSLVEHSRFTLSNEMFSTNGPLGAAGAQVSPIRIEPVQSSAFAQRRAYGGRGRGRREGAATAIVLG